MDASTVRAIVLDRLGEGLPGITPAIGQFLAEAAALCLEHHRHPATVSVTVVGTISTQVSIVWSAEVSAQARYAWDDELERTEFGACGIALLLTLELTPYTVIRRARRGQGIDYWLGLKDVEYPFQDAARLEISGILNGDAAAIQARVREKQRQAAATNDTLPGLVIVVEFSRPLAHVVVQ